MCLLFIAHRVHPEWPLIIAANRDEWHSRATRTAGFWPEQPDWLGGKDLEAGGSWLLASRTGRLAALTNVRAPSQAVGKVSRGQLVHAAVASAQAPTAFCEGIDGRDYSGFNLICGAWQDRHWQLSYTSNRSRAAVRALEPGLYGLSNAELDTPWPKVTDGKAALRALLDAHPTEAALRQGLWQLLADGQPADPCRLPNTGVGKDWETLLSSRFIVSSQYGTRASTLLLCDVHGRLHLRERSFDAAGNCTDEQRHTLTLHSAKA